MVGCSPSIISRSQSLYIDNNFLTCIYDKREGFGYPIVNFPKLGGDVPRLPIYGIYISQLVRFARSFTSVLGFNNKSMKITLKPLPQGNKNHKLPEHLENSLYPILNQCQHLEQHPFKNMFHPVFCRDPVNKQRGNKYAKNYILSGSIKVKRLQSRQYDPFIIERTIGLVLEIYHREDNRSCA